MDRRLVVLMEDQDYRDLQRQAERLGRSMASIVREAVREKLAEQRTGGADERDAAVDLLCEEHDPEFDWARVKQGLERRYG